ncbi:hypothetical protein QAD02_009345 [Eretmocerus hayati]|uniref:Uncharacterized protein n=1 Tax=Eretmocerus hayati TaxID=131215 RepID=A0ACC2N952_9HYME|nr:hypothetical protein QAD02_009345 [Eretmocerus hayati]
MTLVGLESQPRQSIVMLSVQQQSGGPHNQGYTEFTQRGAVIVQTATGSTAEGLKAHKKKVYTGAAPASVARRNARERNRVKQVNNGFATLRQHIPQSLAQALGAEQPQQAPANNNTAAGRAAAAKKLSKVETLRMAVEYIKNLQQLLDEHDAERMGVSPKQEHHQAPDTPTSIKFELKSECSGEDEPYPHQQTSSSHQLDIHQNHQSGMSPVYIAAPCSEASSSPTPSFVSDASSAGGSQGYGTTFNGMYAPVHHTHGYENYEPMSPEDEELLDYISLWQHGQ